MPKEVFAPKICTVRNQRVVLDSDLALLYGVETRVFNQAVRRNRHRFPSDFAFQLTRGEWHSLRSQIVILKGARGRHRKYLPSVFTEHGAIMAAMILNSERAVAIAREPALSVAEGGSAGLRENAPRAARRRDPGGAAAKDRENAPDS
ncbi:MAG: hypothetical protein DME76_14370 [Verrucomicrobia bacterium]|nr:MAG: hypothetical protein DME76_14370 [Verrucomicrobiota bacterium]